MIMGYQKEVIGPAPALPRALHPVLEFYDVLFEEPIKV